MEPVFENSEPEDYLRMQLHILQQHLENLKEEINILLLENSVLAEKIVNMKSMED